MMTGRTTVAPAKLAVVSAFLVVLIAFTFSEVRHNGFVNYDDPCYILDNAHVRDGLDTGDLRWALTSWSCGNWHPLTWIVHASDVELFGLNPGAHHLVGVAWHAAAAIALFLTLVYATGALGRSALVAALFAVHPLHVQSVVWASERKDLVSALLAFATIAAYVAWTRRRTTSRAVGVLGLYGLGLTAKPMLVTLPFVLLLLDVWPLGRIILDAPRKRLAGLIAEKLPLFALAAVSCAVTFLAQRAGGSVGALDALPLGPRLANAVTAVWAYVGQLVWPTRLSFLYPFDEHIAPGIVIAATGALAAACVTAIYAARRAPWVGVGWFWYLGTLIPVIGIVQVGAQARADRYTYIPSIGLFVLASWGGASAARALRVPRATAAAAGIGVVVACALASRAEVPWWKDTTTLFRRAVAVTKDNGFAQYYLAKELAAEGKDAEAIEHYSEAARLLPSHVNLHFNYGNALMRLGRFDDAVVPYAQAAALAPGDAEIRAMLGIALARAGRTDEARLRLQEALRIDSAQSKAKEALQQLSRRP